VIGVARDIKHRQVPGAPASVTQIHKRKKEIKGVKEGRENGPFPQGYPGEKTNLPPNGQRRGN